MLSSTENLPLTELTTMCRQELSHLLDPVHPLGRDWALFALNIGLDSKVQLFDNEPTSPFLALIDTWTTTLPAPTIGENKFVKLTKNLPNQDNNYIQ